MDQLLHSIAKNSLGSEETDFGVGGVEPDSDTELWSAFTSANSSTELCQSWLDLQCQQISNVDAAVVLLRQSDESFAPAAIWPDKSKDVSFLGSIAEQALSERRGTVRQGTQDASDVEGNFQIAYPVQIGNRIEAVAALDLTRRPASELQDALRLLHWGTAWVENLLLRRESADDRIRLEHAAVALDLLSVIEQHDRLEAAAIALADEMAVRLKCDRVAIGLRQKNRVRVQAISHSAWFQKKSQLVANIQNAMEEALEQNVTVIYPQSHYQVRRIDAAHRDLAGIGNAQSVVTVVINSREGGIGAITLERFEGEAFSPEFVTLCEIVATLLGPMIGLQVRARRWVAGRLVDGMSDYFKRLFGPRHPTLKVASALAFAVVVAISVARTEFRVPAKAALEGSVQLAAVAPFAGYIADAPVRAGERVGKGQVLAKLDDRDLELEQLRLSSEVESLKQQNWDAQARGERSEMSVLLAKTNQAKAQLALTEERLARTQIASPIDGIVVSGDLSQLLGSPVEQGQVLFELAPLDSYRVVLKVDEHDMRFVEIGQTGKLVLTGLVDQNLEFTIKRLTSVSTPEEGGNYFRVEASMEEAHPLLRPGMEGTGKIVIGQSPLLWVWTRRLIQWARIKIWEYRP